MSSTLEKIRELEDRCDMAIGQLGRVSGHLARIRKELSDLAELWELREANDVSLQGR